MKTKYNVFLALSLFVTMFFTACAEELSVNERVESDEDLSGFTCFSTESDDEGTRTAMYPDGRFKWMNVKKSANAEADSIVDNIFVIKGEGDTIQSTKMVFDNSRDDNTLAKFYLTGSFDKESYPLLYAGSTVVGGQTVKPGIVAIPTEQVQSKPNNSDHFGVSGDCGIATAQKKNGSYAFKLQHQMAYLMFEPRIDAGKNVILKKITIEETTGKNIAGTFTLQSTGIVPKPFETDSVSKITIYCGTDVKAVEEGTTEESEAKNYGFYISNTDYSVYNGEDNGRVFAVIRPNDCLAGTKYNLKVTYHYIQYYLQKDKHQPIWKAEFEGVDTMATRTFETDFETNKFYRLRHKLDVSPTGIKPIPFKQYYMWGATNWFWKDAENAGKGYPVKNDGYQSDYEPQPGSGSWYRSDYQKGDVCVGSFSPDYNGTWWVNRAQDASNRIKGKLKNGFRHTQAQGGDWNNALTANQMSFYVVFGDPYYDDKTLWILEEYNGVQTLCRGGVWLKKKEKIREYLNNTYNPGKPDHQKVYWPDNNDAAHSNYSAPFPTSEVRKTKDSWPDYEEVRLDQLKNQQFNLRYMAPSINYRMPYTNLGRPGIHKPSDDGKNDEDYFFLPCLGRFEYDNELTATSNGSYTYYVIDYVGTPKQAIATTKASAFSLIEGTGKPTLTLVGEQGYYWTRTPLMYQHLGSANYFHKYVYDNDGNLLSEWSLLDKYETRQEKYERYAELLNKGWGSMTDEEKADLEELEKKTFFYKDNEELPASVFKNVYRYAQWLHFNDNAYYLNLHHNYIALSWQQHSIYVKTGMRIATNGYDEGKNGIFK